MKKIARPIVCVLLSTLCVQCLTGCFDSRELNTIGIVMGTAIDKADEPDRFEVTVQIASPNKSSSEKKDSQTEKGGGAGGETKEFLNVGQTGSNVNYIIREMQNKMSRMIYMAHSQNIVFGEELAKEGVRDCLDFFARAPEVRMSQMIFTAKGKALDVFDVQPEFESMPSTMLTKMLKDQKLTSEAPVVTLYDFICCMIRKTKCPVMPIVRIVEDEGLHRMEVDGCAVFKDDKMIGELDETQTRGMLIIENEFKTGVMSLQVEDASVTAEIIKIKSSMQPVLYEDGSVEYNLEVYVTAGVGDQTGSINLADADNVTKFLAAVEDGIKSEIQSAVDQSKKLNADVFGFGEMLRIKYPDQWKDMEDNWDAIFPQVVVKSSVKAKSDGSGAITEPLTTAASR